MVRLGYKNIFRLPVGYAGWKEEGQPIAQSESESRQLGKNDYFPECNLISVYGKADQDYLHINPHKGPLALSEIRLDFLYVEIYNDRCLGCIAEITNYKNLYNRFKNNEELDQKIRIIGIGAGSNDLAVSKFRKENQIPFPLFADANWDIFECLGSPILPTSYLLKREENGKRRIIYIQRGHIEQIDWLMNSITKMIL